MHERMDRWANKWTGGWMNPDAATHNPPASGKLVLIHNVGGKYMAPCPEWLPSYVLPHNKLVHNEHKLQCMVQQHIIVRVSPPIRYNTPMVYHCKLVFRNGTYTRMSFVE